MSFFGGPFISFIRVLPLLLSSPLTAPHVVVVLPVSSPLLSIFRVLLLSSPLSARVVQVLEWMEVQGKDVRTGEWSLNEIDVLNKYQVRAPKY